VNFLAYQPFAYQGKMFLANLWRWLVSKINDFFKNKADMLRRNRPQPVGSGANPPKLSAPAQLRGAPPIAQPQPAAGGAGAGGGGGLRTGTAAGSPAPKPTPRGGLPTLVNDTTTIKSKLGQVGKSLGKGGVLRGLGSIGTVAALTSMGVDAAENARQEEGTADMADLFRRGRAGELENTGPGYSGGAPLDPTFEDLGDQDGFVAPGKAPEWARNFQAGAAPQADPNASDTPRAMQLRQMGVPQGAIDSAPIEENDRRAVLAPGGRGVAGQTYNLGKFGSQDPNGDIFGTADENGRVNSFAGVGTPRTDEQRMAEGLQSAGRNERALEIAQGNNRLREQQLNGAGYSEEDRADQRANQRERRLRADLDVSTPSGQRALTAALSGVETQRLSEINGLRSNAAATEQQTLAGNAQRDVAGINADSNLRTERLKQSQLGARSQAKATADAAILKRELGEKGWTRYNETVDRMFSEPDGNGGFQTNKVKQEQFRTFVESSDLILGSEEFTSKAPQAQANILQDLRRLQEMGIRLNEAKGQDLAGVDPITMIREATWEDATGIFSNDGISYFDYLFSNLPFTDNKLAESQSGREILRSKLNPDRDGNVTQLMTPGALRNQ
jgi:hypothetical protein